MGWPVKLGCNGACDTVTKDRQDIYLQPNSFSEVLDEDNIQSLLYIFWQFDHEESGQAVAGCPVNGVPIGARKLNVGALNDLQQAGGLCCAGDDLELEG